jgi:hypothetical protein
VSDTVTGAVLDPGEPEATGSGHQSGLLAGMLSAVEPARQHVFDLAHEGDGGTLTPGASSAAYHSDADPEMSSTNSSPSTRQQHGVIRSWLLAGAERWRKGADARLKHLDMQKARHQATQVKEVRSVNRSEKFLGGSSNAGSNNRNSSGNRNTSGKSLNSKTARNDSKSGPLNSSGNGNNGRGGSAGKNGPAGRNGNSGSSGGSHSGGGRSGTAGGNGPKGRNGTSSPDKRPKQDTSKPSGDRPVSGKTGPQGPAGSSGKNGAGGGSSTSGKTSGPTKSPRPDKAPGPDKVSLDKTKSGSDKKQPDTCDGPLTEKQPKDRTDKPPAPGKDGAPGKSAPGAGTSPGATATGKTDKKSDKAPATDPATPAGGKTLNTRASRETGYRDGTRAAKGAVHVQAYRHGFKDGWTDTQEAAAREKTHLDEAHQNRKKERDEDKPVAAPRSSADYHQPKPTEPVKPTGGAGPQPIPVKSIDATHIHLGDGAARQFMSRGEVRSLKSFERRLEAKAATMAKVAESSRGLKAHADAQAQQATQLLEAAKGVKGGEKLIAHLSKLGDLARAQAAHAEETHKRAVRGADACRAILANVKTRYGGIYQAVVNSPETAPAELAFYKG